MDGNYPVRVLLIDDHALFREGLASLLNGQGDIRVVGEGGSVKEAIDLARNLKPDLILLDISLPDGSGIGATREILAELPQTKIVCLTVHEDNENLFSAMRSGAKGYLLKNIPVSKLLSALRSLNRGEAALSRVMMNQVIEEIHRQEENKLPAGATLVSFTRREREILRLVLSGATNHQIAERLFISEFTIKNHIHNILTKLGARTRNEIIEIALRQGWTSMVAD